MIAHEGIIKHMRKTERDLCSMADFKIEAVPRHCMPQAGVEAESYPRVAPHHILPWAGRRTLLPWAALVGNPQVPPAVRTVLRMRGRQHLRRLLGNRVWAALEAVPASPPSCLAAARRGTHPPLWRHKQKLVSTMFE